MTTHTPLEEPSSPAENAGSRLRRWLLTDTAEKAGEHTGPHGKAVGRGAPWWRVMCLTGLDYFSTLGYQPAIAALAAGLIAPLATLLLVAITLFGALPVYRRVARESPNGAGSIAMLSKLLPKWGGKLAVLALLGFAATDFMITMTLSAADATAHAIENPFAPDFLQGQQVIITLALLAGLGVVFLRGFTEAIRIATVLVGAFLLINAVVLVVALAHIIDTPLKVGDWWTALTTQHGDPWMIIAIALIVFPKLALGLSGFETGVAVMPQIRGEQGDPEATLRARVKGAHRLLTTSALIMSAFLVTSSIATVVLIPQAEFQPGGKANGRALAYLAHQFLGDGFGTVYDVITIAILWFAGASAMAGLLNLVPRYLPHYGMAPRWARAIRPLVIVFTCVAFLITIIFQASVDDQGGAYATGVLVLMTSAAVAVTLSARGKRERGKTIGFGIVTLVFLYTTVANIIERPDGIKIAACFILGILVVSFVSRVVRSIELRATTVQLDPLVESWVRESVESARPIQLIAHDPKHARPERYAEKLKHAQAAHRFVTEDAWFIEVTIGDSSDFEDELYVVGDERYGHRVLSLRGSSVPNSLASVLIDLRDRTGYAPHIYFRWTEGNPASNFARFLLFGEGEIAPMTREVLRIAVPEVTQRPWVHVG